MGSYKGPLRISHEGFEDPNKFKDPEGSLEKLCASNSEITIRGFRGLE